MKSQFFNPMVWFHEFLDAKSGLKAVGRRTSKITGQNDELEDDTTFDTLLDSLVNDAVLELLRTRNNALIGNSHTKNDFTLETPAINSLDDCEDLEKLTERERGILFSLLETYNAITRGSDNADDEIQVVSLSIAMGKPKSPLEVLDMMNLSYVKKQRKKRSEPNTASLDDLKAGLRQSVSFQDKSDDFFQSKEEILMVCTPSWVIKNMVMKEIMAYNEFVSILGKRDSDFTDYRDIRFSGPMSCLEVDPLLFLAGAW